MQRQRHRFTLPLFLVLIMILSFAGLDAFAHTVGASLNGQVTDPTGAAIPGASISLKNIGTGLTLTEKSADDGVYRISPLPPGNYDLTVEAGGFHRYVQQGIVIAVDTPATQKIVLKTGSIQQTVTVKANGELLNTTSGSLGQTIDSAAISHLPLNGRTPATLVLLAPGMTMGATRITRRGSRFPVRWSLRSWPMVERRAACTSYWTVCRTWRPIWGWKRRFPTPTPRASFA